MMDTQSLEKKMQSWRKDQQKENIKYILLSAAGILTFLAVWQLAVTMGLVNEKTLPAPTKILETLL